MNRIAMRTIVVWSISLAILTGAAGLKWAATAEPRQGPVFIAGDRAVTENQVRSKLQDDGANLALLEGRNEDAVRPPRQEPRKVGLAHRQREAAQIVAVQNSERNRALVRRHEVFLPSRRKVLDLLEFQD